MQKIGWYYQRLRAMSAAEIVFRIRRAAEARIERLVGTQPSIPDFDLLELPEITCPRPDPGEPGLIEAADSLLDGYFDLFDLNGYMLGEVPEWNRDPKTGLNTPLTYGKAIDYRDEKVAGNIKYVWEPSRHLMVPMLARAFRSTGDVAYLNRLTRLVESWIDQCPYPNGLHWCSSLESGIRLINWSFAWRIVGGPESWIDAGVNKAFLRKWLQSIYLHMRFIHRNYSKYSSANNHLIGEAAGAYVAAVTWPAWHEAASIRRVARKILVAEIQAQTHEDGVNAEQAISYQQFVLDFFVVAGLLGRTTGDEYPQDYWLAIEKMVEFLNSVIDVNGNVPMIGDADDGYVLLPGPEPDFCNFRSLLATAGLIFERPDFAKKGGKVDYKTRLLVPDADGQFPDLIDRSSAPKTIQRSFPAGGYFILGCDFDTDEEVRAVVDGGPLGMAPLAAHGHADALSLCISVGGTPVLIDPGTYCYHTEPKWRNYFRGTSAHNTLRIDGVDQSTIAGNFLWRDHSECKVVGVDLDSEELQYVDIAHDGYMRLTDPVLHERIVAFDPKTKKFTITDKLACSASHDVEIFFHFPEHATINQEKDHIAISVLHCHLRLVPDPRTTLELYRGDSELPLGWFSPRFHVKRPSPTVVCRVRINADIDLTTVLAPA